MGKVGTLVAESCGQNAAEFGVPIFLPPHFSASYDLRPPLVQAVRLLRNGDQPQIGGHRSGGSCLNSQGKLAELRKSGQLTNLAKNAGFRQAASPQEESLPAEFGAWQDDETPTGTFAWDAEVGDGSERAAKVKWGCFIQDLTVQPGEDYAIEVSCRPGGHSQPTLVIRWKQ